MFAAVPLNIFHKREKQMSVSNDVQMFSLFYCGNVFILSFGIFLEFHQNVLMFEWHTLLENAALLMTVSMTLFVISWTENKEYCNYI